jgi:hypothetical protein
MPNNRARPPLDRCFGTSPNHAANYRLADRLRVGGIVLLPFDIGLDVARWHQPGIVAQLAQLPAPEMSRCTRLHTNQAARQFRKEVQHLGTLELALNHHLAGRINPVNLKHRLREIQSDCHCFAHGSPPTLLPASGWLLVGEPSTASTSASWINQVERFFANLSEKQIRRGVHRSTRELEKAIRDYIAVVNDNPKPFR